MSRKVTFTTQQQERYFALRERGKTSKEAADGADISHNTIMRWVREGKKVDAPAEKAQFAHRYEALKFMPEPAVDLTQEDLVKMLEAKARNGTVTAMLALLNKPWETKATQADEEKPKERTFIDELQARRTPKSAED